MTHNDYDNTHVSTRNFRATRKFSAADARRHTLAFGSECISVEGQRCFPPAFARLRIRIDNRHDFPLCFWFGFRLYGEENVAFHSTIPFYVAFWWNVATTAQRHV